MEKYPVHNVERNSALGMYDLEPGKRLQFNPYGESLRIVESHKAHSGRESYAIVQTGVLANGDPHYTAYTNSPGLAAELMQRMKDTYLKLDQQNQYDKAQTENIWEASNKLNVERDDSFKIINGLRETRDWESDFSERLHACNGQKTPYQVLNYNPENVQVQVESGGHFYQVPMQTAIDAINSGEFGSINMTLECSIRDMNTGETCSAIYRFDEVTRLQIGNDGYLSMESKDFLLESGDYSHHMQPNAQTIENNVAAQSWAQRCLDTGKESKVITDYDINSLVIRKPDGQRFFGQEALEHINAGDHVTMNCTVCSPENDGISQSGTLVIPDVQNAFVDANGHFMIESRSSMFADTWELQNHLTELSQTHDQTIDVGFRVPGDL